MISPGFLVLRTLFWRSARGGAVHAPARGLLMRAILLACGLLGAAALCTLDGLQPDGSLAVPENTTAVNASAMENCASLVEIRFPSTLMSIGERAFAGCTSLVAVRFGANSSLAVIGDAAFAGCTSLASLALPHSLTSLGSEAMLGCTALTKVTFPRLWPEDGIGPNAFADCPALDSIDCITPEDDCAA